ncbi:PfkB family carbohydrate kinase [Dermatophilaceae bacterium Soc4.6]
MGRVVVVGSLNIDLVIRVERMPSPGETVLGEDLRRLAGGKGANQAVAAAEAGAEVVMLGCIGGDEAGQAYARRLVARGIRPALTVVDDETTGHAIVTVDGGGENAIVVVPGANGHLGVDQLGPLDDVGPGDVVLLQLEVPLPTVVEAARRAHARGARVVLNAAPYAALPGDVVALADPLVVNESEAAMLADGEGLPSSLLVTFGGAGSVWDGERVYAPSLERVIDTTGAGDAYCGALAAALARGAGRSEALQAATDAGTVAVQRVGAQTDPALR